MGELVGFLESDTPGQGTEALVRRRHFLLAVPELDPFIRNRGYNKSTVPLSSESHSGRLTKPKESVVRTYSLWPVPSEAQATARTRNWRLKAGGRLSCRTESFICEIWRYLQVDNARMEVNQKTPSGC